MDSLLAPCNQCPTITDKETGYLVGPSVTLFKTFNGSNRYVYQVHGRSVAVLLVASHSSKLGRVVAAYSHPDYINSGLFRHLYRVASKDFKHLRLGDELSECPQVLELIHEIKTA
jgi:hypothetical protein